jgi:hypothetical protein
VERSAKRNVDEIFARVNRSRKTAAETKGSDADEAPKAEGPNNPDADAADADGPEDHGAEKPNKAGKERASQPEPHVVIQDSLADKVAQVCEPPETKQSFRYPFLGESVDIESSLDEVKEKVSSDVPKTHADGC